MQQRQQPPRRESIPRPSYTSVYSSFFPWYLLFARTRSKTIDAGETTYTYAEPETAAEKEGQGSFRFWMIAGVVLCLAVAIGAVSCGRQGSSPSSSVNKSLWIVVLILALVIVLAVIAIDFWKAYKAQKNLEAQQIQAILNTPLETFSELEEGQTLDDLAKKYSDMSAEELAKQYEKS